MKKFRLVVCGWLVALVCAASPGPDFTIVVLPDTQFYSEKYPAVFDSQVDWILANRTNWNIVYVAHLGDITNNGDKKPKEWLVATNALYRLLAAEIPLGVVPGNHDHVGGIKLYNKYFGPELFAGKPYYGGHKGKNNRNHYDLLSASGVEFVVVYLDFNYNDLKYEPIDAWAKSVLQKYPQRNAIVVSHCILKLDGELDPRGKTIYGNLKEEPNLTLMWSGHYHGENRRSLTNGQQVVMACLSDYQSFANGGNGFLRLYQFSPSNNLVRVKTYSPWVGQSLTNASSQFEFPYSMTLKPHVPTGLDGLPADDPDLVGNGQRHR